MEKDLYRRFYEIEDTHWWFVARKALILGFLTRYLADGCERTILDAGCGTGGMLKDLETFGSLVASDLSEEAANFCKLRGYEIIRSSVLEAPFRANSFDVVLGLDLIEHVDDDVAALREMHRICKPGGLLMVTVPAFQLLWSHHDVINHHKRRYTKRQLQKRLGATDFEVLRCSYFNSYLFPFMVVGRLVGRVVGQEPGLELNMPNVIANRFLSKIFSGELSLLKWSDMPFGGSLLAIAGKTPLDRR
jgi:SAM-dependent methyltransferase